MYGFTRNDIDLDAIRARLAKMNDAVLLAHGRAAEFMAGRSTRETWIVQLREARGVAATPGIACVRMIG